MAKLVIIDDEAAILELMSKLCKAAGHQVIGCTTGIDGIAAIRANGKWKQISDKYFPGTDIWGD